MEESTCIGVEYILLRHRRIGCPTVPDVVSSSEDSTHCTCDIRLEECFFWAPEPKFYPRSYIFQDTELAGIIFSIVMLNISPQHQF